MSLITNSSTINHIFVRGLSALSEFELATLTKFNSVVILFSDSYANISTVIS